MRKLLVILFFIVSTGANAQDSLTAIYINAQVDRIEERIQFLVLERKDTIMYEALDTLRKGTPLSIRTEYYINLNNNDIEKIVESTRFRTLVTELTVYYRLGQPIRFTTMQMQGNKLKLDFDVYYMNGVPVHFEKRLGQQGVPDSVEFLKWCYDLLNSYRPT